MTYQPPQPPPGYGPPQGYGQPSHGPSNPWFRRTWALILIPVVALLIGVGIGTGSKKTAAKPGPTVTATTTSTAPGPATTRTLQPIVKRTIATKTRTRTVTYTPPPKPSFSDGKYAVGSDITSGTYRTDGGGDCYFEIDSDLNGGVGSIVSNDNFSGQNIVHLQDGQFFQVSGGCDWRHE